MTTGSVPRPGAHGEAIAAHFLEARGYTIEARNLRIGGGELDLVARRGGWLAFVEVKWRRAESAHGGAAAAWSPAQRVRALHAALAHLGERGGGADVSWRFDLIQIEEHARGLTLTHQRGAWSPGGSFW